MQLKNLYKTCALFTACIFALPLNLQAKPSTEQKLTDAQHLTVATWNVEHLASLPTQGCKPRSPKEMAELKAYADNLQADIVALQEVDSIAAVQSIFPANNWQIFISDRPNSEAYSCRESGNTSTQQKVAYAVKKHIAVKQLNSLSEFALGNPSLRYGLELVVDSPVGELTLLNLHLKSGCFVDNHLNSDSTSCQTFSKQAPILDSWVEQKELKSTPYIILGDFNHRLTAPYNRLTQTLTDNQNNSPSSLVNTTKDLISCHPRYKAPIDHIFTGHLNQNNLTKNVKVHAFNDMREAQMLSDHCALSLTISKQTFELSNSVKWQRTSAEYQFLTRGIYQDATETLKKMQVPDGAWAVVMDIDETVLDNSSYQVQRERIGERFSPSSWNDWVISEQASLVPGAKEFITEVLDRGGKLALITNRNRQLDKHTWNNLIATGLPVSIENTCLMGRTAQDKLAIDSKLIKNDKDLRREQISNGSASCFYSKDSRHSNFGKATITMQVGDNIEDFASVLQHDADIQSLLNNPSLVLLPNPMYGSW